MCESATSAHFSHIFDNDRVFASCASVMTLMFGAVFCVGDVLSSVVMLGFSALHLSLLNRHYRDLNLKPAFACI